MAYSDDLLGAGLLKGGAEGFVRGWADAEDRSLRKMELDAKLRSDETQRARQAAMDEVAKKDKEFDNRSGLVKAGYKIPSLAAGESIADKDISNLPVNQDFFKAKAEADPLQAAIRRLQLGKEQSEASQRAKGFKLPPDKVLSVQQGAQIPTQLKAIQTTLDNNANLFGPIQGRLGAANQYDEKAQTIDAQVRSSAQAFGRFMEGGVLRKEDEDKYRKMFPQLSDTPEVAKNKLAIVNKMLVDKQNADTQALSAQGYDTSGFQSLPEAELPGLLTGKTGKLNGGMISTQPSQGSDVEAKRKRLMELKAKAAAK